MSNLYQDIMTPKMRHDLALHCYKQGFLDEPPIGQWPANLDFSQQTTDADQNQQPQPDPHYFAATGQEPPPAPKKRWWNNAEVNVMLFVLAAFVVILAVCPVW